MEYKNTIESAIWSEPNDKHMVRKMGMKSNIQVFNELKDALEKAGLMPDEYFLFSAGGMENAEMPEFSEAVCSVNFGGNEGIYLDVNLKCSNVLGEKHFMHFATGKTLGDTVVDFYRMSLIAGECSMLLNGDGCRVENNAAAVLILDETETAELKNALALQAGFNEGLGRSNETVYGMIDAVTQNNTVLMDEDENEWRNSTMIVELGKLLNEVKTQTITSEKGDKTVLNNRIMIYQGKNRTTFVDITAWGGVAEFIEKHFKQGEEIFIEGELKNKTVTIEDKTFQSFFILVTNARIVFGKNTNAVQQEGG